MKSRPILFAVAALVAAVLSGCSASPAATDLSADDDFTPIEVTDASGNDFTFTAPVDRIVSIGSHNTEILIALGLRDKIVGVDSDTTLPRLPYAGFTDDDVVGTYFNELNYDAIVAAEPDIVLIPDAGKRDDAAAQLESAGIPVLTFTGYDVTQWHDNIELLATIFDVQSEADEVLAFTDGIDDLISERLGDASTSTVYYEDSEANATIGAASPKSKVLEQISAVNVFSDGTDPDGSFSVTADPAEILAKDPEFVFREVTNSYEPTGEDALQDVLDELTSRPGWGDLAAVQDGNVYVYNAWIAELAGRNFNTLYWAKWAHPEEFADVDPGEYVQEWAERIGAPFDSEDDYFLKLDGDAE